VKRYPDISLGQRLHGRVQLDVFRHAMLGDEVENLLRLLDACHAARSKVFRIFDRRSAPLP
jgi:hypothetical protein